MCHAGTFRVNESNESTKSNAVIKVIATEFYYRFNEGRRRSPLIYAYKEDHCPCALHFVSKPSNRANYARRTKEATNASDNVCVSCDGINLRRDNAVQGVFEMRIIEGPR